jgi:hypothetical protein
MKVSIALFLFVFPLAQLFAATTLTSQPCDNEYNTWLVCLSNEYCAQCFGLDALIDPSSVYLDDACTIVEDYNCPGFECCPYCQYESSAYILCDLGLATATEYCQSNCNGVDIQETFNGGPISGGTANDDTTNGGTSNGGSTNGGTSNGGTSNGGSTNGGTSNGGSTNGGSTSGGTTNGGTTSGGSNNGGTNNGGTNNGGSNNGRTNNGGTNNGGSTKSGALKNSEFVFVSALASVVASVTATVYLM